MTVFCNAIVHTMTAPSARAEAFVVEDGKVVFTGSSSEARAFAGVHAALVDLAGKTVVPGFCDSHLHLYMFGAGLLRTVELLGSASLDELFARLSDHAARYDGPFLLARGFDQSKLSEDRFPTRTELDIISPDRPLLVTRVCGHAMVVNSAALALVTDAERAAGDAEAGLYTETAITTFYRLVPPLTEAEGEEAVLRAAAVALKSGITSVGTLLDTPDQLGAYARLRRENSLPIRITGMPPQASCDTLYAHGIGTTFGDAWLKFGGAKFFADGSLGAYTALMAEPYEATGECGTRIYDPEVLKQRCTELQNKGFQIVIHAIGDQAVRESLDAIEFALHQSDRDNTYHRHRIEHVSILPADLLIRMVAHKIVGAIQPQFVTSDTWTGERVGEERAQHAYPFAAMRAAGVPLALGSDCPVEKLDAFLCLDAAVNRHAWTPHGGLSVDEALYDYTVGSHYALHQDHYLGRLTPGYLADFVVLSDAPTPRNLTSLTAEQVYLAGNQVLKSAR
ncbi:amidohydrolase [Armatimonas sp.]|uniref:amidohydrolase n=1 Tax=Armatimonas sp. TaxID=1872638 RepID=UPI00286D4ECC|nr:amidohydrolase [Armatimonas sp.]